MELIHNERTVSFIKCGRSEKYNPMESRRDGRKRQFTETEEGKGLNIAVEDRMIEIVLNDRLGKKIRVKCNEDDLIGDLKKLVAAQIGTRPEKIRLQKWHTVYKDHITLEDYEIHDGMGLELYYD